MKRVDYILGSFFKVDLWLILTLRPDIQNRAIKLLNEYTKEFKEKRFHFHFHCPSCNAKAFLSTGLKMPNNCALCGFSSPHYQIETTIKKIDILIKISEKESDEIVKRILLEQAIVISATGIEIFLRHIYATILNLRYIQRNKNLYNRFYEDSRNSFINIGQALKTFKKDLNVDIKKYLKDNTKKTLNILMLKRNVIIHNSGYIDQIFLNQSGLKKSKGFKIISISLPEIRNYLRVFKEFIKIFVRLFQKEVTEQRKQDFIEFVTIFH